MLETRPSRGKVVPALLVVLVSASLSMIVEWRAPGLSRYANDWLMRARGPMPVPQDIAIVAIDEKSIAEYGRFPWPRHVIAEAINRIKADGPKAIGVDVIFADQTNSSDDSALAKAIVDAGNVVLGAQLVDAPFHGGLSSWLLPQPLFARAAAALGHVNVQSESEGTARQIAVQVADDSGKTLRTIAVETLRIGERTPEQAVTFTGNALIAGDHSIPVDGDASPVVIGSKTSGAAVRLLNGRMNIDYIGAAGSFESVTYSLANVIKGAVPPGRLRDKYVLIGATAASQSDRVATPFVRRSDANSDQHGVLMPGVEVLANALNTILRSRFYSETGDGLAFFGAVFIAAATLFALELSQGRPELLRQSGALVLVGLAVVFVSYLVFSRMMIYPPLVPGLVSFGTAGMLGLLWRNLAASSRLDESIAILSQSSELLIAHQGAIRLPERNLLPGGLEWKVRKMERLHSQLVERARFVDQALRSVEDGLIVATPAGIITFANRSAGLIFGVAPRALEGQSLADRVNLEPAFVHRVVTDRAASEREIEIRGSRTRRFVLRMAPVTGDDHASADPVTGIVASLSDVTRQHDLQQTKNDVIALVSHEMRTPLTAIQGLTELLSNYELDAAETKEISGAINSEVKRLTAMITEYLDITRLESGATELRKTPVRVDAMLQRIVTLLEPVAAQRKIRLELLPMSGMSVVFADSGLLSRAVENLVSNAIKYSPENKDVFVSAAADENGVTITVADTGYGISESDLERVFEKFYRVPRVEDADVPGTGLGLALVRNIAELHGGRVTVASKVGIGSTFTMWLPRVEEQAG
jgi:PAS domain S-box-containing protein